MPQATTELTNRWNGPSDETAMQHLHDRGFILTRRWEWVAPEGYRVSDDDRSAIMFLIQEWDFGGLIE